MTIDLIVEIGNTHEGSLGVAKSFVLMAKKAGAKTVKFQMHIAEAEGTKFEQFRVNFSDQDLTRQDYWRRVNFSDSNWIKLATFCLENEMEFICTPISVKSARFMHENNLVRRWKVGSGNAVDWPLLDSLLETGLPLMISTGLISPHEINLLKDYLKTNDAVGRTTLLHCVSSYPVKLSEIDLHLMNDLRIDGFNVGYSDHSGSIAPSLMAFLLGARTIEVHFAPRKDYFGPDVSSSLTPEQIETLISISQEFEVLSSTCGTKNEHFERTAPIRNFFRKGVYWKRNMHQGEIVGYEDLNFLKPVVNLDVVDYKAVLNKVLKKDVDAETPVSWDDFRNEP